MSEITSVYLTGGLTAEEAQSLLETGEKKTGRVDLGDESISTVVGGLLPT